MTFPNTIDTFPTVVDKNLSLGILGTPAVASQYNDHSDTLVGIQNFLGIEGDNILLWALLGSE